MLTTHVNLDTWGLNFQGLSGEPFPGMIVACPHAAGDAAGAGHVGMLDYDGSWINVGKYTVNKSVMLQDESNDYKPNTMRAR